MFRFVGQIFTAYYINFLDPLNPTDLFCVHYAILPEVDRCLQEFMDSWNNHRLCTASNLTPEALFTIGLLEKQQTESAREQTLPTDSDVNSISLESHGMEAVTAVDVPNNPAHLCSTLEQDLSRILVNIDASDFELHWYMESIRTVGRHI